MLVGVPVALRVWVAVGVQVAVGVLEGVLLGAAVVVAVGVDVGGKATIHKVIRRLAAQGLGVLVISDEVPELIENCNRMITMHDGQIVETLETAGLQEEDVNDRLRAFS